MQRIFDSNISKITSKKILFGRNNLTNSSLNGQTCNYQYGGIAGLFKNGKVNLLNPQEDFLNVHGIKIKDEYLWLDRTQQKEVVKRYLQIENAFTTKILGMRKRYKKHNRMANEFEDILRVETGRNDQGNRLLLDGYLYFSKEYGGRDNSSKTKYFKKAQDGNHEIEILDTSEIFKKFGLVVECILISEDSKYIGFGAKDPKFGVDHEGSALLIYKNDVTNPYMVDIIHEVYRFVWGEKDQVFYTALDQNLSSKRVYQRLISQVPYMDNTTFDCDSITHQDILVFQEFENDYFVDLAKTKDNKYILVYSNTHSTTEPKVFGSHCIFTEENLQQNSRILKLVKSRSKNVEMYLEHYKDRFILLSNCNPNQETKTNPQTMTPKFKIYRTDDDDFSSGRWMEWISMGDGVDIQDLELFDDSVLVQGVNNGIPHITLFGFENDKEIRMKLPLGQNTPTHIFPSYKTTPFTNNIEFKYSSPVDLPTLAAWDTTSGQIIRNDKVTHTHWNPRDYLIKREMAPSHDGHAIPLTIVHHKLTNPSPRNKMLIHVYGCYGVNMETSFRLEDVYLLKSGWIIVYVHVRGGRELGKNWHLMGMGPNKLNSMLDLISSTNHLHHKLKYSSPSLTAATAHSAGGLVLVSSLLHPECTNLCRNPANEIIRAVVLQAPFLDPVSALLASPLPSELAEWGDVVNKKDDLDLVLSYSPYELIRKHSLNTNLLILAGEQDQRVPISQSIKFICRLKNRLHPAKHKRALLFVDFHSGHFNSFSSPTASEDYDPYHQRVIRNTFLTNVIDSNEYA